MTVRWKDTAPTEPNLSTTMFPSQQVRADLLMHDLMAVINHYNLGPANWLKGAITSTDGASLLVDVLDDAGHPHPVTLEIRVH
jgi:hypothetical protein